MMMETADEMTMTLEELRRWIRGRVVKMPLVSPAVLEKCHILQSLLERKERRASCLLKLCKSLAACEEIVKKQYAVLGWEYLDKDSDSDDITEGGDTLSSPCESVHSENNAPIQIMNSSSLCHSKKQDFTRTREEVILNCLSQKRKAVVVLTRLPEYCSTSVSVNERTEAIQNSDKPAKQQNTVRSPRPRTRTCSRAARRLKKMSSQSAIMETKTKETPRLSADSEGSTLCKHDETRDVLVNAKVLARRRIQNWQQGRITEVVKKENGKLKYKVCFEERGKSLVSVHHIALDITPEASQLCVGSSVVVRCENKASQFRSGIVAELPSETNDSRFLILMDGHTSIYTSIHCLRLVFQPPKATETSPLSASQAIGIQCGDSCDSRVSLKEAVVVPHQLPAHQIDAPLPPTARQLPSEDESLTSSDSDMQWEPQNESDDSVHQRSKRLKTVTHKKNLDMKDSKKDSKKDNNNDKLTEPPHSIISRPFSCQAKAINKVPPDLPEEELQVNMMVLARRKGMAWFKGEITEVLVKENERLKYKVKLEEDVRVLVSRYHLAFNRVLHPEQLFVGARVVVPSPENASCFVPGILAELPCTKNHLRFLVFLDDHTPMYLFLPALRLVCRQLPDVTDDIPAGIHRDFMKRYIKFWPRTDFISYKVGDSLSVQLNGVHQSCEVVQLDCSLMQVLFQGHQRKEWIHRGSFRIFLMAKFYRDTLKENADSPE